MYSALTYNQKMEKKGWKCDPAIDYVQWPMNGLWIMDY